jgi:hypothetical protein
VVRWPALNAMDDCTNGLKTRSDAGNAWRSLELGSCMDEGNSMCGKVVEPMVGGLVQTAIDIETVLGTSQASPRLIIVGLIPPSDVNGSGLIEPEPELVLVRRIHSSIGLPDG